MKKRVLLPILVLLIGVVGIGWTSAFLTDEHEVVNAFSMGKVEIDIEEEFKPPTDWNGSITTKKVQINNLSEGPVLIRVAITPRWLDEDGKAFSGDLNLVQLNFNDSLNQYWTLGSDGYYYYKSRMETAGKTETLLESVQLKESLPDSYKGKTFVVDVEAEAVQATKEAYESTWKSVPNEIKTMLEALCK